MEQQYIKIGKVAELYPTKDDDCGVGGGGGGNANSCDVDDKGDNINARHGSYHHESRGKDHKSNNDS